MNYKLSKIEGVKMTITAWVFVSAIISFAISAITGKFLIPFLHKLKYGQTIRDEGPKWHQKKQGTPTMGGIMIILAFVVVTLGATFMLFNMGMGLNFVDEFTFISDKIHIYAGVGMALGYGVIGFIDDYIKVVKKRNLGLTAKQKLLLQFVVAVGYLTVLAVNGYTTQTIIPFVGTVDLGFAYYIIASILIVGTTNATNLNDGVDGLCGSITFFGALIFMLIATITGHSGLSVECATLAGACLGFLVWNFNPAKVFMGDTGSLFLGGVMCAIAFATRMPILLILVGIAYYWDMISVMLQVSYFKLTHGKRLFKMSPIHHHYELCGWSEKKIVLVFSLVTVVFGAGALLLTYFGV